MKVNKRRAGRWFLKAAKQGRKEAQYNVAMMCHFGRLACIWVTKDSG